jgi:peptidoglycan hydrolase CwlO-like protein
MFKRYVKKILVVLFTLVLLGVQVNVVSNATNLSDVQQQMQENESKQTEVQNQISDFQDKQADLETYLNDLNKQLNSLNSEISKAEAQIANTEEEIAKNTKTLEETEALEDQQYQAMKKRIQFIYELQDNNYLDIVLQAGNFSDLINKVSYVKTIVEYDRDMLSEYNSTKLKIEQIKNQLDTDQQKQLTLKQELNDKKASLNSLMADSATGIEKYKDQIEAAEAEQKAYEKEMDVLKAKSMTLAADAPNVQTEIIQNTYVPQGDDERLLATLIYFEAGSTSYDGMRAVGSVVLNRVNSKQFSQNTIYDVIYAPGQFTPVSNQDVFTARYLLGVPDSCTQAAKDILNNGPTGGWLFFLTAGSTDRQGDVIGGNVFFYNW